MMKSELAKARDKWLLSDDGKECCEGQTSGQYLQNRLERAFIAGSNFSAERIKELEAALLQHRWDLHQHSNRPCPTCRKSAEILGLNVPDECAKQRYDEQALKGEIIGRTE